MRNQLLWSVAAAAAILFPASGFGAPGEIACDVSIRAVAFSPDGKLLATGGGLGRQPGKVELWDAVSGERLRLMKGHSAPVCALAFSPDGKTLVSGGEDKAIIAWDVATGEARRTVGAHRERVSALAFSADGKVLASGSWDGVARVWDAPGIDARRKVAGLGPVSGAALSPDGKVLATCSTPRRVPPAAGEGRPGIVAPAAGEGQPGGMAPAAGPGQADGMVKLWGVETAAPVGAVPGHAAGSEAVAFSPDGSLLASAGGSQDRTVRVWDARTRALLQTIAIESAQAAPGTYALALAFAPNGRTLAVACSDGTVRLWGPRSAERKAVLRGHDQPVNAVAFSPDGTTLASGADLKEGGRAPVRLWDVRLDAQ